jgi:hypothetical protein
MALGNSVGPDVNQAHLRHVPAEYEDHYNRYRPHRTVRQESPLTKLPEPANLDQFKVRRRDRLGGINPERRRQTHIHQLEALGYKVTIEPAA